MPGATRIVQEDFSAGMFRAGPPERIPSNGAWDIVGLLDRGTPYRRGGTIYLSADIPDGVLTFLWDGFLTGGHMTILATTLTFGNVVAESAGAVYTNAGGSGLAAPARPAVYDGTLYLPGGTTYDGITRGTAAEVASFYAIVAGRLLAVEGDTVRFSGVDAPGTFDPTDFHKLPGGVSALGVEGLRDAALVFTTGGVYVISGLSLNLTDADGNVQHRIDHYSTDLRLWGDAGIAGWSGSLVVPALDGVHLMSLGVTSEAPAAFVPISGPIDDLYRSYVRQGYKPGGATVYRGTYLLPILNGTTPVDLLTCRLDAVDRSGQRVFPWTHLEGYGAEVSALAVTKGDSPILLGAAPHRVLDCRWFDPAKTVAADADGSIHGYSLTIRSVPTGPLNLNTVLKVRARYELSDETPNVDMQAGFLTGTGASWGAFDWGGADWTEPIGVVDPLEGMTGGDAPEDPTALTPFSWRVAKRRRFIQIRFSCADAVANLRLHHVELFVRDSGRI